MVLDYYKLLEQPFGVTPDARFLMLSPTYREALASVLYGVSVRRGFSVLIARPGMGKTTLLFDFLNRVKDSSRTVFLFQPQLTPQDLLRSLLADLGVEEDGTDFVRMHRKLTDCLLNESKQGKQLVVVVDEAQNLDQPALEFLRMLSNFETPREKLMHLILAGQPQLAEKLESPRLTQLRQRISIVARLRPLSAEDTATYINHRLKVAGYTSAKPLFTKGALAAIARQAEGIPRNINNLCFNAMSLGCALGKHPVDEKVIAEVIQDLDLRSTYAEPEIARKPASSWAFASNFLWNFAARSRLKDWALKFAVLAALLALVGLSVKRAGQPVTKVAAVAPAVTPVPLPQPNNDSSEVGSPAQTTVPVAESTSEASTIEIAPDATLSRILVANFGRYDDHLLSRVRDLNPRLQNPDYIQAGQKLRIPGQASRPLTPSRPPNAGTAGEGAKTE